MSSSPCLCSLHYKLVSSFSCLYSLQYELGEFISLLMLLVVKGNTWTTFGFHPMFWRGFQFDCFSFVWYYFLWFLIQRGWHFFVFEKINSGHVAILLLGYYLEYWNSLQVKVFMCKQNLDSTTMSQKKIQFNYNLLGCFHPPWFRKRGQQFFSYKRPIWVTTFVFWSISNLKFLVWPCWVKTHKKPNRVLDVKHI